MIHDIDNNTILICNNYDKKNILKQYDKNKKIVKFKIMNFNEFITKMTFTYDTKAIYYLMHTYHIKYDIALIYLQNMIYIDKNYDEEKLSFLYNLKNELRKKSLIKENTLFKKYIQDKKIIFYHGNYDQKFIKYLCKDLNYCFIDEEKNGEYLKTIYHFQTIDKEISFVANEIINLIENNVDISKIKLVGVTSEYKYLLKIIFDSFNLKVNTFESSLYATICGKEFINNLSENINDTIEKIKNKYPSSFINEIINICNKYYWCNNFNDIKELLEYELKKVRVPYDVKSSEIEIINYNDMYVDSDNYYFLIGFNNENLPISYKDTEYIDDTLCSLVNKENSNEKFLREKEKIIEKIRGIKNLIISYKDKTYFGDYTISHLNDDLNYEVVDEVSNKLLSYSKLETSINLAKQLDLLDKYGEKSDDLSLLYNSINSNYKTYDNGFKGIDIYNMYKYLNNKLLLSYSSVDNYYKCAFKYYIHDILKLDEFEDSFSTYIGSLMHYILSIYQNNSFDYEKEFNNYLETNIYPFSFQERFFLNKVKEYLKFIISEINNQRLLTGFDKEVYEKKILLKKDNKIKITFMGIIDKIMYLEKNGFTYLSIIDYKTGHIDTNLKYTSYGLQLQLPIYAYLLKNSNVFSNPIISGLYYQKLLNKEVKASSKEDYEKSKKDSLKLEGISTSNLSILEIFDSTYENSDLIKSMKMTSKGFSSFAKVFSDKELEELLKVTEDKIDEAITNIVDGHFKVNPKRIKDDNIACKYCSYRDICFVKEDDVVVLEEGENDAKMDK